MVKKIKNKKVKKASDKKINISDVLAMLPTDKEAEQYANGNFGYPEDNYFCC